MVQLWCLSSIERNKAIHFKYGNSSGRSRTTPEVRVRALLFSVISESRNQPMHGRAAAARRKLLESHGVTVSPATVERALKKYEANGYIF